MDYRSELQKRFPMNERAVVVRAIRAAFLEAQEKCYKELSSSMDRRARTYGANNLHYLIDKYLIAAYDEGRLTFRPSEQPANRGGYAYSRYLLDGFAWIHKKADSPDRLPTRSAFREEHARGNQGTFDFVNGGAVFGETVRRAIITWGQKNLELTFVVLGIPMLDYSRWAYKEYLTGFTGTADLFAPVMPPSPTNPQGSGYSGLRLIKKGD